MNDSEKVSDNSKENLENINDEWTNNVTSEIDTGTNVESKLDVVDENIANNNMETPSVNQQTNFDIENNQNKKSKKKLFFILGGILIVALVFVMVYLLTHDSEEEYKEETKKDESSIIEDTELNSQIMGQYGDKLYAYVRDYIGLGNDVSKLNMEELTTLLENNKVVCEVNSIDNNGNIKLDNCVVNDSLSKYSYEKVNVASEQDGNYYAKSKNGKITFKYVVGTTQLAADLTEKTYTINCEEKSCVIENVYGYHAIVRENSGKKHLYNFKNKKKIYTVLPGYDLTIIGDYDKNDREIPSSIIILKSSEGEEALFNTKTKEFVYYYGEYTYPWSNESDLSECTCSRYRCEFPIFDDYLNIYKDGYAGLISTDTYEIIVEPNEYTTVENVRDGYILTSKDKKVGLLYHNKKTKNVELLSKTLYDRISVYSDYIYVKKDGKYSAFDVKMKNQYLNGKYYDAIGMAKYNGKHYGLILTNSTIKLLDENGKIIKTFDDVFVPDGAEYANINPSWFSNNSEQNPGFKVTDPENLGALSSSNCELKCSNKYSDDSSRYLSCVDKCQRNYLSGISKGCINYYYDFDKKELRKITDICENFMHC